jgi:hypothetical protein
MNRSLRKKSCASNSFGVLTCSLLYRDARLWMAHHHRKGTQRITKPLDIGYKSALNVNAYRPNDPTRSLAVDTRGGEFGAGGGNRTHTGISPTDFKGAKGCGGAVCLS